MECLVASDRREAKIYMGPLLDYDNAFDLYVRRGSDNPEGFSYKNQPRFVRMFENPPFVAAIKERFRHFHYRKDAYWAKINKYTKYLELSVTENDKK